MRKYAKGFAVLMATGMTLSTMSNVFALESETQQTTNEQTFETSFTSATTEAANAMQTEVATILQESAPKTYDEAFRVPSSSITKIVNNAGHYGSSTIDKAIDDKTGTHWETNKPNNDKFHNMVTFTFDQPYEISTMKYLVRQDGAKPKGFPLAYILYYSTTDSGEDFQVLKEGSFTSANGSKVDFTFAPTQMRRFRIEFVQVQGNWASMAEAQFYQYDEVKEKMDQVFTDHTYAKLTEEYNNLAAIEALEKEVANHPDKAKYQKLLDDAKLLLNDATAFDNKLITVSQRGNPNKEASRTRIWGHMYALDPTGYYVTPGEKITVYVEADEKSVLPQLVFGQIGDDKNGWRRAYNLKPGINEITAPGYDNMKPAAIYFSNQALPEDQPYAPVVRFVGGTKFPLFVQGVTDTDTFKKELDAYIENVSFNDDDFANGNPNGYYYNIAEITSENVIISTSAAGASKEVNAIVKSGKTVEYYMDAWEDMYYSYAKYSGFDTEDETSANYMPRGKFNSRVFTKGPYGWADYGYTGYNGGNTKRRDTEFFSSLIKAPTNGGWGLYHEWGHVYDSNLLGRGESTNNLYSLLMQDKYRDSNRMVDEKRWNNHFTAYHNTKNYPQDQLFYGAIVYQLQGIYGDDLYAKASLLARENKDGIMTGLKNNNDRLAVALSFAIGEDVTCHFDYYKQTVSAAAKEKVKDLPKNTLKTWYANDKVFAADASAFANAEAKPVIQVDGSNQVNLQFSIAEAEQAVLNYEVYRDGEYLGVTYSNTFTDKNIEPNKTYTYTVVAYDRKLHASLESEPVAYNPTHPLIMTNEEMSIALYSTFDPLANVKAYSAAGTDITDRLSVVSNNVDPNQKGSYEVEYRVEDEAGNAYERTQKVNVVAKFAYLSDLEWVSAETSYKTILRDASVGDPTISLYDGTSYPVYEKGLGAHANSKIVYDIEGKGYESFEAYVGINHRDNVTQGSVTFEVWVDGVKQYDSGIMKSNTKQKFVKVDVAGAKEVTLIATDAKDGNGSDHAVWADAKFSVLDAKPEVNAKTQSYMEGDSVDLLKDVSAFDAEDGDLTNHVEVITDYRDGMSGTFDVTYRVQDKDGNIGEKTVKLIVANRSVYLSDMNWKSAQAGWGSVHKDKSVQGNTLRLTGNSGIVSYEKGIGTHAKSTIVYDISDQDYAYFTAYVGVDREMSKVASVKFQVIVDGVVKETTPLMTPQSEQLYLKVDIAGAKELKLVVTDGGNGIGSDHADWADAKLWTGESLLDTSQLVDSMKRMDALNATDYTSASWDALLQVRADAEEAMLANNQETIDGALKAMNDALDQLEKAADVSRIDEVLAFAKQIKGPEDVKMATHKEERFYNLEYVINILENMLQDMKENRNLPQEEIDRNVNFMIYTIEECGYEISI